MSDTLTIDGLALPVVKPADVAALCGIVKAQRAKREAVYPVGGRTMLDFGLPPTKPGVAVDMTGLNAVIDYPARDMTITVQAGITFAKLQALLAAENQWLPLDVPDPENMTIGGLIACNVSGPRRYGYGTLRDYLLGIHFITDDGVEVKGGGRVVKNVAGYDLMKLHLGALGTMGIITQVTLKVKPRPETSKTFRFFAYKDDLAAAFDCIHNSPTRPVAVEAKEPYFEQWKIDATFEGKTETVDWQCATYQNEVSRFKVDRFECGDHGFVETKSLSILIIADSTAQAVAKVVIRPSQVAELMCTSLSPLLVDPMNGVILLLGINDEYLTWPESIAKFGGTIEMYRCPLASKTPERVFGKPTPAWRLMAHIRHTLDPDGVFNPGRMFVE